ncbi:TetR/AcrR family transcriptional regulator [Marmoricola sp. URHB0036]|uniref:TetR/AcrR family transcriptional regulator n=1 Tax=Marmoricola sp. URHB0036 TaxID=1298863 RepID=UPI00041E1DA7|nr:TetR/AcrR family transcriptional regulator [Marmoricola sp. URHB0036]
MKEPNRRDLAAEEARNRILVAAADCIVRDGLVNVRMAGIARAAGVSSGLVHYHFATKEQLFIEVLSHSSAVSNALTEQALERAGTQPAQRLSAFLDRCLPSDELLTHDWRLWQELDLLCLRQPALAKVGADVYETIYASVTDIITAGIESGVFDLEPAAARSVAETAVGLCDGLGARVVAPGPDLPLDVARSMVADAVGRLVGHDGPLPRPDQALLEAGA